MHMYYTFVYDVRGPGAIWSVGEADWQQCLSGSVWPSMLLKVARLNVCGLAEAFTPSSVGSTCNLPNANETKSRILQAP